MNRWLPNRHYLRTSNGGNMSILSKLWRTPRLRADKLRPSIKTGMALGAILAAGTLTAPLRAQTPNPLRVQTNKALLNNYRFMGRIWA
jgi:hypothetical protein